MKTNIYKTVLGLLLLGGMASKSIQAQSSVWQWGRGAGTTGNEEVLGTALDPSGNLYVIGWYSSANITFGAITLTNAGNATSDIFLVKYDPSGNVIWAKSYGSVDGEVGSGIYIDGNSNIYITGWFTSPSFSFDAQSITNAATGSSDIFIAKLNSSGTTIWAKSVGGSGSERGTSIAVDIAGNIYTTGGFGSATLNFGAGSLSNAGANDFFIAKHDNAGNNVWAKSAGGTGSESGTCISLDSIGNAYVTGSFASSAINFGTGSLPNTNASTNDIFVAKYNASGTAVWANKYGGTMDDYGNKLTVTKGAVFVGGGFSSASITVGSTVLSNVATGFYDIVLMKISDSGSNIWAKSIGSSDSEIINGITSDTSGKIYITGYSGSSGLVFGSVSLTNSASGFRELFVAGYDGSGNVLWATMNGGSYDETGHSISVTNNGADIYIGGTFNSPTVVFGASTIYKGCGDDVMIAKLNGAAVGINELFGNYENQSLMFPNPSHGIVNLIDEGLLTVSNSIGQKVFEEKISLNGNKSHQINLSHLPKGVYFYNCMSSESKTKAGKIIVE